MIVKQTIKRWSSNNFVKSYLALVLLCVFSCSTFDSSEVLDIKNFPNRSGDFSLWQLEPFNQETQMGYIVKTDDNQVVVIDGGGVKAAPYIKSYIKQLGGIVHTWIITHGHLDHMGALVEILDSNSIVIKRLVHAPPALKWVQKNEAVSIDVFSNFLTSIKQAKILELIPMNGEELVLGEGVVLEIISTLNPEIVTNAINNSSLVFKISSPSKSVLFLGDMGVEGGNKILKAINIEKLKADYVQMAHHGQGGVDKAFYEAVQAEYALWPTPYWLWDNRADGKGKNTDNFKTLIVREWMEDIGIRKNYVSGLEGTIQLD